MTKSATLPHSSPCCSGSGGVASTARGATGCGVSVVSFSAPPSTAGDHGRSTPFGLTAATANPLRVRCKAIAPCLRKRSRSITGGGQAGGGLPCGHHQRGALAIVRQRVRPQRQCDQRAVGQWRHAARLVAGDALRERRIGAQPRIGVRGQPFLEQKRILGGPHQMQPPVFAADPDIVAIAGNQDIGLRHRQRPDHGKHQHGGAGPAQRRP